MGNGMLLRSATIPSSRGGVDATSRRSCEATFDGADGVVAFEISFGMRFKLGLTSDHPVCADLDASRHFVSGAATPPLEEGIAPAQQLSPPNV